MEMVRVIRCRGLNWEPTTRGSHLIETVNLRGVQSDLEGFDDETAIRLHFVQGCAVLSHKKESAHNVVVLPFREKDKHVI